MLQRFRFRFNDPQVGMQILDDSLLGKDEIVLQLGQLTF